MNLTNIQIELKNIESRIKKLSDEIGMMKETEKETDLQAIYSLAHQHPIKRSSIRKAPDYIKKLYFSSLARTILQVQNGQEERFLYLERLIFGAGLMNSLEEVIKRGLALDSSSLRNIKKDLLPYKYSYLIEAMVISNLSSDGLEKMMDLIVLTAQIFNVGQDELRVLAMVAKGILMDDDKYILRMPAYPTVNWSGKLTDYFPEKWLAEQRTICESIQMKQFSKQTDGASVMSVMKYPFLAPEHRKAILCVSVTFCLENGSYVKDGDVICKYKKYYKFLEENIITKSYEDEELKSADENVVTSCKDGVVYFINEKRTGENAELSDEFMTVYVVSYFDEYQKLLEWNNKRHNIRNGLLKSLIGMSEKK